MLVARLGDFTLSVLGRERPDSEDYYDGNWLNVVASYKTTRSGAKTERATLLTFEIEAYLSELEALNAGRSEKAALVSMEGEVGMELRRDGSFGRIAVKAVIESPGERHEYSWQADLSHLPSLIEELKSIAARYPTKGSV